MFVHPSHGFRPAGEHRHADHHGRPGHRASPPSAPSSKSARSPAPRARTGCSSATSGGTFDFLYEEELEGYHAATACSLAWTRLSRATSSEKVYVQHRMKEHAAELWAWLEEGAHFYVCGDARRMALDVDHALHAIVAEQGSLLGRRGQGLRQGVEQGKRYPARCILRTRVNKGSDHLQFKGSDPIMTQIQTGPLPHRPHDLYAFSTSSGRTSSIRGSGLIATRTR